MLKKFMTTQNDYPFRMFSEEKDKLNHSMCYDH